MCRQWRTKKAGARREGRVEDRRKGQVQITCKVQFTLWCPGGTKNNFYPSLCLREGRKKVELGCITYYEFWKLPRILWKMLKMS